MANPVSSFLQGFQAVDTLETNRQLREDRKQMRVDRAKDREFRTEQQSRVRQMWEREDDEYEALKLKEYKREKAVQFNGFIADTLEKKSAEIAAAVQAGDNKTAARLREMYFGAKSDSTLKNEALSHMMAIDPEFGEHVALNGFGIDAASGALVRNKKRPVSGVGYAEGRGLWFEVDSVNGPQPITERRSSDDDDPVVFREPGAAELTGIFGESFWSDELDIMKVLRTNVEQSRPAGVPTAAARTKQVAPAVDPAAVEAPAATPPAAPTPRTPTRSEPPSQAARTGRELGEKADALQSAAAVGVKALAAAQAEPFVNAAKKSAAAGRAVGDFISGFFGSDEEPVAQDAPRNAGEINRIAKEVGGPTAREFSAAAPESGQAEQVAAPATPEVAQQVAHEVYRNARPNKRPPPEEVYKAYMLAKAGMLSMEDVGQFKQTGTFGKAAEQKFIELDDGVLFQYDANGPVRFIQGPVSKKDAENTDQKEFRYRTELLEDYFVDQEGKPQKGAARRAVAAFNRAGDVLGDLFNGGRPIEPNQAFSDDFAQGMELVRGYEDPRSGFNPMTWFDDRELQDKSGIVGFVGVQKGITSPEEFNDFAYNYGIQLIDAVKNQGWSEARLTKQIARLEDEYKNPDNRKSREEILEDFIEELTQLRSTQPAAE